MTLTAQDLRVQISSSYTDDDGGVTIDKNPGRWSSGNVALYSTLYWISLALLGDLRDEDGSNCEYLAGWLWSGAGSAGIPGLLERNEGRPDQDAWDNYLICVGARVTGALGVARAIYEYGDSHQWVYQNEPGFRAWLSSQMWRFPAVTGLIKLSAGESAGPIERKSLACRLNTIAGDSVNSDLTRFVMAIGALVSPKVTDTVRASAHRSLSDISGYYRGFANLIGAHMGSGHPLAQTGIEYKHVQFNL